MVEAKRSIANERAVDQKPFVIRGHHLNIYLQLVMGRGPSDLAAGTVTVIRMKWLDELLNDHRNSKPEKYGKDVLGAEDQIDKFLESSTLTFETFLDLPDDHPAIIVEGIPDAICGGCAIGKHCRKLFNNDYFEGEVESTLMEDGKYIDVFLENSDYLSLPKPTITQEQVSFSDAGPQQVRIVSTTIGTVKKVLKEKGHRFWGIRR